MNNIKKHELIGLIQEISALIECQMHLKHQDRWLDKVRTMGIWNPDLLEDEEYANGFKKVGEEE